MGASVVNACSEWLTVNVRRDGHEYEQTFRRGDPDGPLKCIGTVADGVTGTRVTFKPDPEMFRDTTVYDFDTLEKRLREESFLKDVYKRQRPHRTGSRPYPSAGRGCGRNR